MNRRRMPTLTGVAVMLLIAALILLLGPYLDDLDARQATEDTVEALATEAEDLQLALYVAEHDAARAQNPSAAEPVRRRHPSTFPESDQ